MKYWGIKPSSSTADYKYLLHKCVVTIKISSVQHVRPFSHTEDFCPCRNFLLRNLVEILSNVTNNQQQDTLPNQCEIKDGSRLSDWVNKTFVRYLFASYYYYYFMKKWSELNLFVCLFFAGSDLKVTNMPLL